MGHRMSAQYSEHGLTPPKNCYRRLKLAVPLLNCQHTGSDLRTNAGLRGINCKQGNDPNHLGRSHGLGNTTQSPGKVLCVQSRTRFPCLRNPYQRIGMSDHAHSNLSVLRRKEELCRSTALADIPERLNTVVLAAVVAVAPATVLAMVLVTVPVRGYMGLSLQKSIDLRDIDCIQGDRHPRSHTHHNMTQCSCTLPLFQFGIPTLYRGSPYQIQGM